MTVDPLALYEEARLREGTQSGYYNRNVRLDSGCGPVVVRMRADGAETMDLTLWPEAEVLAAVGPHVPSAPRLLHTSSHPEYQVHAFVEGHLVDEVAPVGDPLPEPVSAHVETFFRQVLRVPAHVLPAVPDDWPRSGDTAGFARRLLDLVREIRHRDDAFGGLYEALGVPGDPCAALRGRAAGLTQRPFRLLHADIHRRNMILTPEKRVVFLDWELALWGDPVYDLADHIHKMSYAPAERSAATEGWERAAPADCRPGLRPDLDYYLAYEAVKSAVVDTVRWGRRIAAEPDPDARHALARELAGKLAAARPHWAAGPAPAPSPDDVLAAVEHRLS